MIAGPMALSGRAICSFQRRPRYICCMISALLRCLNLYVGVFERFDAMTGHAFLFFFIYRSYLDERASNSYGLWVSGFHIVASIFSCFSVPMHLFDRNLARCSAEESRNCKLEIVLVWFGQSAQLLSQRKHRIRYLGELNGFLFIFN